ncbi:MAG TPA: hypothetical protein VGO43_02595 [Pyrinomonadaceae bacterium]|jgi:hypothetical protein|nr:hypothetical protein [Pyrinomonadaceae bacterium]
MSRPLILLLIVCLISSASFSQSVSTADTGKKQTELEEQAADLLRETMTEVGQLRTPENRISFSAELASLMWFHDPKEARAMYGGVIAEFNELVRRLDAESKALPSLDDETSPGGFFGGGYGQTRAERKLRVAIAVRQQIAMSLAEHEPDMAFSFYSDSLALITNIKIREEAERSDGYFEARLIKQIADSDPAKAVAYSTASLKKGLDGNQIDILQKVYATDADKASEFGAAILSKVKDDKAEIANYVLNELLSFSSSVYEASLKPGGKPSIYTRDELRDMADSFASRILGAKDSDSEYSGAEYADLIAKYSPSRAAQIRARVKKADANIDLSEMRMAANAVANTAASGRSRSSNSNSNSAYSTPAEFLASEEREKAEKKVLDDVVALGKKTLSKDERDKAVAAVRKVIIGTAGKDKKVVALSLLAAQVARLGDVELADEIMQDAERLVNPRPKNYQDFLLSWMLVGGYAEADPDKAFPILAATIMRANETLAAVVKVGEFIDVNDELVQDGEVQIGAFGGAMVQGLTKELGLMAATSTIRTLAKADLKKTAAAANSFDRIEARVLAKMLILRAVLDKRELKPAGELSSDTGDVVNDMPR